VSTIDVQEIDGTVDLQARLLRFAAHVAHSFLHAKALEVGQENFVIAVTLS